MFCCSTSSDLLRCGLYLRPNAVIKRGRVLSVGLQAGAKTSRGPGPRSCRHSRLHQERYGNGNSNGNGNSSSSGTSREAIKKRPQRARKFLMIVELFGTTVLNAAPDVSVSRLDLVSLQLLAGLVHEGNGNRTVETIRRNIGLVR
jgi:hypothetical protein